MVTIRDVAKAAGVSIATVSRVINGHPVVSEKTRRKVLKVIRELHYRPMPSPRRKSTLFGVLAVLIPDLLGYHYNEILMAIEQYAREEGFDTMISVPKGLPSRELEILDEYFKRRVDGVIICELHGSENILEKFLKSGIPVTAVDYKMTEVRVDSVNTDNVGGAYKALKYLYSKGHRKVLYLRGPSSVYSSQDREEGIKKFLAKHRDMEVYFSKSEGFEPDNGYFTVKTHLAQYGKNFTAIFAVCDYVALGALKALAESGLKVPDDVSIIGFDDSPFAPYTVPPLTTVLQPRKEMGIVAAQLLIDRLKSSQNRLCRNVILPTKIVERESVKDVGNRGVE